ncbi:protein of unknown function (plasmid) [Cupriavidus taiwanensis]|uniref:Uncharacterized protein n=1 Tax=Cupriavidus taiwanensis TaxID=164546 RepID=A0A375IQ57_9BURK|nr:hypothetical protein CBM2588_B20098 [Cupriavidus taiwanensis]SOY69957.1 hypothetical protein CBM2592_B20099 [Cupriavidus taiwanensis]SOY92317.1 hypothetical protein CBM2591_B10390 [Cupriavidus taiwanensis]SOZ29473.1 hypothetical protein CBM2608_B20100 [Cupriavidus taiwanensis]SOZ74083.1 hypothetical protein CBM2617_B30072 [Cupriavidus taiwanensis]
MPATDSAGPPAPVRCPEQNEVWPELLFANRAAAATIPFTRARPSPTEPQPHRRQRAC